MTRIILLQIHHEFLEYKVVAGYMQYRFRLCKIISVKHIEHQRFNAGLQQSLANRAAYFSGGYLSFKFITLFQIILYFQYKITRLYAPFSGDISEKIADIGSTATPAAPVVKLVKIENVKITISVGENEISKISKGSEAMCNVPALGEQTFVLTPKGVCCRG